MSEPNAVSATPSAGGTTLADLAAQTVAVTQRQRAVPKGQPHYRVLQTSYIGGRLVHPPEVVPYAQKPGSALEHVSGPTWEEYSAAQEPAAPVAPANSKPAPAPAK